MPTPKAESTSRVKHCDGFKLVILAVFSASIKAYCIKRKKVHTLPYVAQTIRFKLPFSKTRGFEHQVQTDLLKGSKQIYVNWQHYSSDSRKTLLLAPYFTGAFCGVSRLIRKPSDP
jgi:hypothetical protein